MKHFAKIKDTIQPILSNKICLVISAVAAAIALLSLVVFIVALARKHHKRGAAQVLFLIFGSLFTIAFILALILAVAVVYNPFNLFKYVEIAENYVAKLFKLNSLNIVNDTLILMGLAGVVLFAVTVAFTLAAMIAVSVKTKKIKKSKSANLPEGDNVTVEEPTQHEIDNETVEEQSREISKDDQPEETVEEIGEEIKQEITEEEIEESHNIVNEIDALVTGESVEADDSADVSEQLKQAILDGYALSDAYLNLDNIAPDEQEAQPADILAQSTAEEEAEYAYNNGGYEESSEESQEEAIEENQEFESAEEQEQTEEENYGQSQNDGSEESIEEEQEPDYEDYAFYNDEQAQNEIYRESEQVAQSEEPVNNNTDRRPEQQISTVRAVQQPPVVNAAVSHRVRTIVRRPTARSADELIRRVSDNEPAPKPKAQPQPEPKPQTVAQPTQAEPKKQAPKKSTSSAKKPAQKRTKPVEVQAEEQNLPMTRKYIILNRRNAAAVFNEYLNGKKEQDKKKITDNLNTVIIK